MEAKNTLTKVERLNKKKIIASIFNEGKKVSGPTLFCKYLQIDFDSNSPVKIMITVPKKKIKSAVKRNLIKRRIKEAYRKNKHEIYEHFKANNQTVGICLMYNTSTIETYKKIEGNLVLYLKKILLEFA